MNKYFDYAATALPNIEVIQLLLEVLPKEYLFGNPSSNHDNGINAKILLENARKLIAESLHCQSSEIYFTSGGSESDNLALKGFMFNFEKNAELITSTIEHPAILNTCKELEKIGYKVKYIEPDRYGYINIEDIEKQITKNTKLISIMSVNNEFGVMEPINEIAKLAHKNNVIFHSDMVQGVGLYNIDLSNIDMASFSGHKFGAIKGTGILYKKDNIILNPIIQGGGQEKGLRSGTENVFGAIDMAYCLQNTINKKWNKETINNVKQWINNLSTELFEYFKEKIAFISFDGCISNYLTIAFKNIDSRTLQLLLSQEGYCVSIGSACHSNSTDTSYVMKEIGLPKEFQNGVIRITVSPETSEEDIKNLGIVLIQKLKYLYESE